MPIDAVLFDYSGVMTESFGVPNGPETLDLDALFAEMVGAMTNEKPHPWHALERGEISLQSFIDYVEGAVPGASAVFAADSEWNVMANLGLRADRVELVRSLRADGIRVGLVTNNVAEWESLWRSDLPEDLFEVVIDSSMVGLRKPEPEIYALALAEMGGLEPARTIFVDDFASNVEGAAAVGMHGLLCGADIDLDAEVAAVIASS